MSVDSRVRVRARMSMSEIADLAGVRRPVVTTWRRRHPDFPNPVAGDSTHPLFDADEVADWLVATGRAERDQLEADLRAYAIEDLATRMEPDKLLWSATALICLRHIDAEPLVTATAEPALILADLHSRAARVDPDDTLLASEIRTLTDRDMQVATAIDELVEAAWGCRDAFERFLAARDRLNLPALAADALAPELVRLVAALSGAPERAAEHADLLLASAPAGSGDLLTAVVRALPEHATPTVAAAEPDERLARLLRRRLVVHGLPPSDSEVYAAADLPFDSPPADVFVAQIPYEPREARPLKAALDRVGWILDGLAPRATAVVLGPAAALLDVLPAHSKADRLRQALVSSGAVEAVIRLPGGVATHRPGYQAALWVLRREPSTRWQGRVLLADISGQPLTPDVVDEVVADVVTWRRDGYQPSWHSRRFAVQARVEELLGAGRALAIRRGPSIRERDETAPAVVAEATELEVALDRLAGSAAAARKPIRAGLAVRTGAVSATAAVGALLERKWIAMLPGARLDPDDVTADGHYPVIGAAEAIGTDRAGGRRIDRLVHAGRYPRAQLTEAGDVIVTTTPRLGVYVDGKGQSVVEFPARALRLTAEGREHLRPRVLAAMLRADGEVRASRPSGAVRSAQRLPAYEIRLLPADEVERLDALLASLDDRRAVVQTELDTLDALCELATRGLADGTLALTSSA